MNAVSCELSGNGLFLSVNYGRVIVTEDRYFIAGQIGIGFIPFAGGVTIPHQITFDFGKGKSFLETGLGGTYWTGASNASGYTETEYSYNISPIIGYRFQPDNGFVLRVYLNPLINLSGVTIFNDYPILPYFGISLGYTF